MLNEEELIRSIDARFPYFDEREWRRIVVLGTGLSPNAAFMVLHEICRPGRSVKVKPEHLKKLANFWRDHFQHPLAQRVYEVASRFIDGERLPTQEILDLFEAIRPFKDQYNALGIIYFASNDFEDSIEALYDEIIREWQAA